MGYSDQFFHSLGIDPRSKEQLSKASRKSGISVSRLRYYNGANIIPTGIDLDKILSAYGITEVELQLRMGQIDRRLSNLIANNAEAISNILEVSATHNPQRRYKPVLETALGSLYQGDCIEVIKSIESDSIDAVFADPPFNLSKIYPSSMDDNLKEEEYLQWQESWIYECIRVLKPGGAILTWNLPKWNIQAANYLSKKATFRHWIAVDLKYSLPIKNRLYPSHYSLLYYIKGEKPNSFRPDRLPTETCPKCYDNLKDYGGYKNKMNPAGVSLTDVWTDISPVRHAKYKKRASANELPVKLLDRIIEMTTSEGDVILDPFGGSGTTYAVSELKKRNWIGIELGPCDDIIKRFDNLEEDKSNLESIRENLNALYPPTIADHRRKRGLWTAETYMEQD